MVQLIRRLSDWKRAWGKPALTQHVVLAVGMGGLIIAASTAPSTAETTSLATPAKVKEITHPKRHTHVAAHVVKKVVTHHKPTPTPTPVPTKTPVSTTVTVSTAPVSTTPATTSPRASEAIPVEVTAYALEGSMADGNWTHWGACAVSPDQFPFGTVIDLYNQDGSFNRQCVAEDTGSAITDGRIDLSFPGDENDAVLWGRRYLLARVERWGW